MRKKLIEVALPLDAINKASAREKSIRHGHPSTLHLWWARRPLAAARAVIFAQMVDDPSSYPDLFPTEKKQEKERQRLFRIIEELVLWENTTNEEVLQRARDEIWASWRRACTEYADHPRAKELFDRHRLPAFHDPFAGGGSLPLEAQRLGLETYASDLNPVAVLINKAMIEIPQKFAGRLPVNPESRRTAALKTWKGAQGLADDVRCYGQLIRDEAERRIGHLYPKFEITAEMTRERPDLGPLEGRKPTVIAWIWARTVKSPNPAFATVEVPLVSTFVLSRMKGNEAYVEPVVRDGGYFFTVKTGKAESAAVNEGTKLSRGANFRCLMSDTPIAPDYIKAEGRAGRLGMRLMAVVAEGERGRIYLAPSAVHEAVALQAKPAWRPEGQIVEDARAFTPTLYGLRTWGDLFTNRQLVALATFSELVLKVVEHIKRDALNVGMSEEGMCLADGGDSASAYAQAVAVYLALVIDRLADYNSGLCTWHIGGPTTGTKSRNTFSRQALSMTWDIAEVNPLSSQSGSIRNSIDYAAKSLAELGQSGTMGFASQGDATSTESRRTCIISTDPPYYDNVPYADLSDFFFTWLRPTLKPIFPDLFTTLAVPKTAELVAFAYRHEDGRLGAEKFFLEGMTQAMRRLAEQAHPGFPVTVYYAFKQSESDGAEGTSSTGWETFLDAVIRSGFAVSGTWPMRTELSNRMRGASSNALASSVVLVCRPRPATALVATRREFLNALKGELPSALAHLQRGNIAPVDLAQSAIGPGMAVFTRYSRVIEADGAPMPVRKALQLINQTLDECLAEQEGEFDGDTRFAVTWYETHGMEPGPFGTAETLATARAISVQGVVEAGVLEAKGGKVRLLKRTELPDDWDPETDKRLTVWEATQHLIKRLEAQGESGAAELLRKLGGVADAARDLCYRLYTLCERKKWAEEAGHYNSLIVAWPEISKLASQAARVEQKELF